MSSRRQRVPSLSLPLLALAVLVLLPATSAQSVSVSDDAELTAAIQTTAHGRRVEVDTRGAEGPVSLLAASFDEETAENGPWPIMIAVPLGADGSQALLCMLPQDFEFPDGFMMYVRNVFIEDGFVTTTPVAPVPLGKLDCIAFDFNESPLGELGTGEWVTDQYASIGVHISAENNQIGHPDKAIIFDSENPTGGDDDLMTPGTGTNNDTPLGKVLIIATDDEDEVEPFGFVDDPNDENAGGELIFEFDDPVDLCGMKVLDVDDIDESKIKFWSGDDPLPDQIIRNLGDNSVVFMDFLREDVTRMSVCLGGSGAVVTFNIESGCPGEIDFDVDDEGLPLGLVAGEEVTTQIPGVTVSAENNNDDHPDKAIIFDTENVTGGDNDLATPGLHPTNDELRGNVLIIAENDAGADGDGIVDEPDDEAGGGVLRLVFDEDRTFQSATVLDIDASETAVIDLYDAGDFLLASFPLSSLGNGSVETVFGDVSGVRTLELVLSGSGALVDVVACPEDDGTPGTPTN